MDVSGSTALVTGAGRGLGAVLVDQLLGRGAAVVYAGARHPIEHRDPRVVPSRTLEAALAGPPRGLELR